MSNPIPSFPIASAARAVEPIPEKGSRITVWSDLVNDSSRRVTNLAGNIAGCLVAISSGVLEMSLQMLMELRIHVLPLRSLAFFEVACRLLGFLFALEIS